MTATDTAKKTRRASLTVAEPVRKCRTTGCPMTLTAKEHKRSGAYKGLCPECREQAIETARANRAAARNNTPQIPEQTTAPYHTPEETPAEVAAHLTAAGLDPATNDVRVCNQCDHNISTLS